VTQAQAWKASRGSVTIKDVARAAGVNPATVSRALNPAKMFLVTPETRSRVQEAARALGYQPHFGARSMRSGRTTTIGVVVADITNPIFGLVVRGISNTLEREGFLAFVTETQDDRARLRHAVDNLIGRRVDAFIIACARAGDRSLIRELSRNGTQIVLAMRNLAGSGLPAVVHDDVDGGSLAAAHLLELGHRRISTLPGPTDRQSFADRYKGFNDALAASGMQLHDPPQYADAATTTEGQRLMEVILAGATPPPTAVFAHNDDMAVGAINAIRRRALDCPGDISVVGYNDAPFMDQLSPPLTTIRFPADTIGRYSGEIAIRLVKEPSSEVATISFPPKLIRRQSTAPPREQT
jgi:LacI family transcriptional regulator